MENNFCGRTRRAKRDRTFAGRIGTPALGFRNTGRNQSNLMMAFSSVARWLLFEQFWVIDHFSAEARALAVALMIASEVIVAPLVVSTPLGPCRLTIFRVVSLIEE
jgi:hypothetical protein